MSEKNRFGPAALIKATLQCDDATAEEVRRQLAALVQHQATRAFIAKAWHLANTTIPAGGKGGDRAVYINEGKRQAGLFVVACAQGGLDLPNYYDPESDT
ncbi:hypothetical protein ATO8_19844 [Roseivivax marinus]|uniref:Uncharacterized protein n=1 Tax=Roseivivax marinus TaxID=1379903 RepID=W4HDW2_9RHOB|nr:hypothetical protein [Roseivivax marinus]ETW10884.1 hypothetical protein ATO8_19844 [Roseivivax marinus]